METRIDYTVTFDWDNVSDTRAEPLLSLGRCPACKQIYKAAKVKHAIILDGEEVNICNNCASEVGLLPQELIE